MRRLLRWQGGQIADLSVVRLEQSERMNVLATLCSNPAETNAVIGKTMAKILSVTLRSRYGI